jgi:hypothetical protein
MKKDTRIGYMCAVDFQWELGEVIDSTQVYASVESLKEQRSCWKRCGIVKVEVKLLQWEEPEKIMEKD